MLDRISAKTKRWILTIGALLFVVTVAWAADDTPDRKERSREVKSEPVKNIIAPENTREFGLEALEGRLNTLASKMEDLEDGNERVIQRAVTKTQSRYEGQVSALEQQIARLTTTIEELQKRESSPGNRTGGTQPIAAGMTETSPGQRHTRAPSAKWNVRVDAKEANAFFEGSDDPVVKEAPIAETGAGTTNTTGQTATGATEVALLSEEVPEDEVKNAEEKDVVYELPPIPSASMFKATNITGLDVPTNAVAKENPYPALMRIKDLAVLPNRFRADIRECHALFSGYGEISSERAYLRATTLTCMRNDGAVLESKMEAYVVGEDGKAGIRGRLVERQGKFIANAAIAGVADGISKVFSSTAVPTIATGTPADDHRSG
ncbi:TrbI/VirB10 family protein [Thalassospira sp. CH_XMU1420-2]|uniref:TrbI/VirB10 family protein n=1 Tax=Thalassospira sp. CH_XMU1420-2 TaxID=3107769 RepID=UPI0030085FD5